MRMTPMKMLYSVACPVLVLEAALLAMLVVVSWKRVLVSRQLSCASSDTASSDTVSDCVATEFSTYAEVVSYLWATPLVMPAYVSHKLRYTSTTAPHSTDRSL